MSEHVQHGNDYTKTMSVHAKKLAENIERVLSDSLDDKTLKSIVEGAVQDAQRGDRKALVDILRYLDQVACW